MDAYEAAAPLHLRLRTSKTTCYWYSETGRRRVLAQEKALRRKAARLGLKASKGRGPERGWTIIVPKADLVWQSQLFDWQAFEELQRIERTPTAKAAIEILRKLVECRRLVADLIERGGVA